MPTEKRLICTLTGEPYQPARVYYDITNSNAVRRVFKKLSCMAFDREGQRWVWLYEFEAQKLRFANSHNQIPKDKRPVIIGYFIFRGEHQMILDLRSLDRVCKAIEFFDKRINRRIAKATHLRIVNRLFSADEHLGSQGVHPSLNEFFDREDIPCPSKEVMTRVENMARSNNNKDEAHKMAAINRFINELEHESLPEIEEIPINFYEEGIESLRFSLSMRQAEVLEHWKGNKNYSPITFIRDTLLESGLEGFFESK